MNANRSLWQNAAWYAAKVFMALRLITLLWASLFILINAHPVVQPYGLCETETLIESAHNPGPLLNSFMRWDTVCYLQIAEHGYGAHPVLTVWPPVYPALIRLFGFVFQPPVLAALIVSNLAMWLTFTLLYVLIMETHDEETAQRALYLYAIFPTSFFLVAGYTESTFLVLVLASFLLVRKKHWMWAGILAGLSVLVRTQGFLLALALFWEGYLQLKQSTEKRFIDFAKIILASSLPVLAFGGYALYVHNSLHAGWIWHTLEYYYNQHMGLPWEGILGNARRLLTPPNPTDLYWWHWLPTTMVDLLFAILVPVALIINLRSQKPVYPVYAWSMLIITMMKLGAGDTLVSFSRYLLTVFPFFIVVAPALNKRHVRLAMFGICLILQGILMYMFYIWSWAG